MSHGKLYIVGTPIGNLGDFSERAKETLQSVDFIAAEDTRVTAKLLNHFDIKKPMISYFEHNKTEKGDMICRRILLGESCALVTDAGMPCVSDPGTELVAQAAESGIEVVIVPGPSAVVSALALSGLGFGRFCFEGFLSVNKKSRREHLEKLRTEERIMVFYEAPHKLKTTLKDLFENFGNRKIAICREITKLYEETLRMRLSEALALYDEKQPKGEFVLVLEGASAEELSENFTLDEAVEFAETEIKNGKKPAEAAAASAKKTGFKKNDIYKRII